MTYYPSNKALPPAFKSFYNFSYFAAPSLKQITQGAANHANTINSYLALSFTEDPEELKELNYYSYRQVYFNDCDYYNYNLLLATCRLCNCTFTNVSKLKEYMLNLHSIDTTSSINMTYKRNLNYYKHAV